MKITSDVICTALIHILRERQLGRGMCIGMETLQEAWQSSGLRSSDLRLGLCELEAADVIHVYGGESRAYVELTGHGADLLFPQTRPCTAPETWMDDVALFRIRQRARGSYPSQRRRDGDEVSR